MTVIQINGQIYNTLNGPSVREPVEGLNCIFSLAETIFFVNSCLSLLSNTLVCLTLLLDICRSLWFIHGIFTKWPFYQRHPFSSALDLIWPSESQQLVLVACVNRIASHSFHKMEVLTFSEQSVLPRPRDAFNAKLYHVATWASFLR